ncbi:MAG: hypothetical protein GYB33_08040 [Gammaproteobacteria bacterium]|nr:hypothetical protein [Gammaproteobacteria bacterium]
MKRFLCTLLFSVCSISTVSAGENYPVEVVKQENQRWRFQRLNAFQADNKTKVSGLLTAHQLFGLPRGHIDIAAFTPSGKLIAETTTNYVPAILSHKMKKKGGVRFTATFDQVLSPESIVKVAFHRDEPRPKVNPSHSGNIAQ